MSRMASTTTTTTTATTSSQPKGKTYTTVGEAAKDGNGGKGSKAVKSGGRAKGEKGGSDSKGGKGDFQKLQLQPQRAIPEDYKLQVSQAHQEVQ